MKTRILLSVIFVTAFSYGYTQTDSAKAKVHGFISINGGIARVTADEGTLSGYNYDILTYLTFEKETCGIVFGANTSTFGCSDGSPFVSSQFSGYQSRDINITSGYFELGIIAGFFVQFKEKKFSLEWGLMFGGYYISTPNINYQIGFTSRSGIIWEGQEDINSYNTGGIMVNANLTLRYSVTRKICILSSGYIWSYFGHPGNSKLYSPQISFCVATLGVGYQF